MSESIANLEQKIENLELTNAKKLATISNLHTRTKKRERIQDIYNFLWNQLQIDVRIDDAYEIGLQTPPVLVIVFQTIEDRRLVFANKEKLKKLQE